MPEVAGDAALIVDPSNTQQITDALLSLIDDDPLAQTLKDRGLVRSRLYSWEKNAKKTHAIYRKLI